MEGFVTKRSRGKHSYSSSSSWKVRWLVLEGNLIKYFTDPLKKTKKGKVRLSKSSMVLTHPDVGMHKHIIMVKAGVDSSSELVFSADSAESRKAWMVKLIEAINECPISGDGTSEDPEGDLKGDSKHFSLNKNGLNSVLKGFYKSSKKFKLKKKKKTGGEGSNADGGDREGGDDDGDDDDDDADDSDSDSEPEIEMVPVSKHPAYTRYFKMLDMGLPVAAAKNKMMLDKLDPYVLDLPADATLPLIQEPKPYEAAAAKPNFLRGGIGGIGGLKCALKPQVRKKKLFLKAVRQSMIGEDSLWAAAAGSGTGRVGAGRSSIAVDDINLDEAEFAKFFIEKLDGKGPNGRRGSQLNRAGGANSKKKERVACVIDAKRAQNAAIALARVRIPFTELRDQLVVLDDAGLSLSQLRSLKEFLPTPEEADALRKFAGSAGARAAGARRASLAGAAAGGGAGTAAAAAAIAEQEMNENIALLGAGERYMYSLLVLRGEVGIAGLARRLDCMIYKQQFRAAWEECATQIQQLHAACSAVRKCARLRRVLRVVLKVVNQLNSDEQQKVRGITLEGLCELQNAKTFDQKTTVLQYIVMVVGRHDADALAFPEELLEPAQKAARLSMEALEGEKVALQLGVGLHGPLVEQVQQLLQAEAERLVREEEARQVAEKAQRRELRCERRERVLMRGWDDLRFQGPAGQREEGEDEKADGFDSVGSRSSNSSESERASERSSNDESEKDGVKEDAGDDKEEEGEEEGEEEEGEEEEEEKEDYDEDGETWDPHVESDEGSVHQRQESGVKAQDADAGEGGETAGASECADGGVDGRDEPVDALLSCMWQMELQEPTEGPRAVSSEVGAGSDGGQADSTTKAVLPSGQSAGAEEANMGETENKKDIEEENEDKEAMESLLREAFPDDSEAVASPSPAAAVAVSSGNSGIGVLEFFSSGLALRLSEHLDARFQVAREGFGATVAYLGEDPTVDCGEFFTALCRFVRDFVRARDLIERARRAEERAQKIQAQKQQRAHQQQQQRAQQQQQEQEQQSVEQAVDVQQQGDEEVATQQALSTPMPELQPVAEEATKQTLQMQQTLVDLQQEPVQSSSTSMSMSCPSESTAPAVAIAPMPTSNTVSASVSSPAEAPAAPTAPKAPTAPSKPPQPISDAPPKFTAAEAAPSRRVTAAVSTAPTTAGVAVAPSRRATAQGRRRAPPPPPPPPSA